LDLAEFMAEIWKEVLSWFLKKDRSEFCSWRWRESGGELWEPFDDQGFLGSRHLATLAI